MCLPDIKSSRALRMVELVEDIMKISWEHLVLLSSATWARFKNSSVSFRVEERPKHDEPSWEKAIGRSCLGADDLGWKLYGNLLHSY